MNRHSALDSMFLPESIAVIGPTAREGSVGRTVVENLAKGFSREGLYAINPKREEVLGLRCYKNLASVPEKVDLAALATPACTMPGLVGECVKAGVRAAAVISAGFKEQGSEGAKLEKQIRQELCGSRMRHH